MKYRLAEGVFFVSYFCERGDWRGYNFALILVFLKISLKILKALHKYLFVDLIGQQIVLKVIHTIQGSQIPFFPHPTVQIATRLR